MTITFLEAGTNATYGIEFWTGGNGGSSSATQAHTGNRSLVLNSEYIYKNSVLADAGRRISFYLYVPTIQATTVFQAQKSNTDPSWSVKLSATGVLQVFNNLSVQLGTDGLTVSQAAWHRISIAFTNAGSGTNELRIWLDGTLSNSISNSAWSGDTLANMVLSQTGIAYFSDIYVDDGSTLDDPGDIRVTAKLPASVNTGNFDTTVGTGAVDERPLSETNGMEDTSINGDQQNYTLQAAAAGDVDVSAATVIGRCAWIWAKISVASVLAKIMDNGSESAITLTTASALYTLLTTSASYPSNAAGIGIRSSTTANTFLYECGTLIAYTPAAGGGTPGGAYSQGIMVSRMRTW